MGEYSPAKTRPLDGGLFPLEDPGTYGRVPKKEYLGKWTDPEPYVKREKKPKIYSSYSISDKCELHSLVMDKYTRGCKVHSLSPAPALSLSRASRAGSSLSEEDSSKMKVPKLQDSLSSQILSTSLDDLEMTSKLLLVRELEDDTRDALKALFVDKELDLKKQSTKDKETFLETAMISRGDFDSSYVV